ncbi:hypothetical protein LY78DRAFT_563916, partial [Colletotrichum sublineola]
MQSGILMRRHMSYFSPFEDARLPSICPTRKSEPGSTPLPRLNELSPATHLTSPVSDVSKRSTYCHSSQAPGTRCCPPPRQTEHTRRCTGENHRQTGLRRPLPLNPACYYHSWLWHQREMFMSWVQHYTRVQKSQITRAPWNVVTYKPPLKKPKPRVKLETAPSALVPRQNRLEA